MKSRILMLLAMLVAVGQIAQAAERKLTLPTQVPPGKQLTKEWKYLKASPDGHKSGSPEVAVCEEIISVGNGITGVTKFDFNNKTNISYYTHTRYATRNPEGVVVCDLSNAAFAEMWIGLNPFQEVRWINEPEVETQKLGQDYLVFKKGKEICVINLDTKLPVLYRNPEGSVTFSYQTIDPASVQMPADMAEMIQKYETSRRRPSAMLLTQKR